MAIRDLLKTAVLCAAICAAPMASKAQVAAPAPLPVCAVGVIGPCSPVAAGGAALLPFSLAVGFAAFVVYADATGIDFPLCGAWGLKCYDRYPGDE